MRPYPVCSLIVAALSCVAGPSRADDGWSSWAVPDEACVGYEAWTAQQHPRTEPTGLRNIAFPDSNVTYWGMVISGVADSHVTIEGQFPDARYMALQVYDRERFMRGAITDREIIPDAGSNNPYVRGADETLGTYTVRLVFGPRPNTPEVNTLYTDGLDEVALAYRVYYPSDTSDLTGGTTSPVLPRVRVDGRELSTCPPRPKLPKDETINGRLDDEDFSGTQPASRQPATLRPFASLTLAGVETPYYPNADNDYLTIKLSREYLSPPYDYDLFVMRMRRPTFANTQKGVAPYSAEKSKQVRYWSVCSNDAVSTGVVRCVPDRKARHLDGLATFVVSDPSHAPDDETLKTWGARWLPWGALPDGEVVYDMDGRPLTNADGVFWYNTLVYRQTLANPKWTQSFAQVGTLPRYQWEAAMGDYWPEAGYCTAADFAARGADCIPD